MYLIIYNKNEKNKWSTIFSAKKHLNWHHGTFYPPQFYGVGPKSTCSMVSIISYSAKTENFILVDSEVSDFCTLTCGIPQGSILGPLLFTL